MPRAKSSAVFAGAVVTIAGGLGVLGTGVGDATAKGRSDPIVELGRRLFFDPAVSKSRDNSCAQCHDPEHGFSSPRRIDADDFTMTKRHSQTLVDVAHGRRLHWDGEFDSVQDLVTARLSGSRSKPDVSNRGLRADPTAEHLAHAYTPQAPEAAPATAATKSAPATTTPGSTPGSTPWGGATSPGDAPVSSSSSSSSSDSAASDSADGSSKYGGDSSSTDTESGDS